MADNFTGRNASGTAITIGAKDISGVHHVYHITTDASGNVAPSGDTVGRRSYVQHTDGTNSTPAMDAAARAGFVQITNGTLNLGVFAEDAAHSSAHTGLFVLAVRADAAAVTGGTDGDYCGLIVDANGRLHVNVGNLPAAAAMVDALANPTSSKVGSLAMGFNGATWDRIRAANVYKSVSAVTITSIATVWTPASGKRFRLMGGTLSSSTAISVLFEDDAAGAGNFIFRTPKLLADTPYDFDLGNGFLSAVADQVLKATGSAAGVITGTLWGVEEDE